MREVFSNPSLSPIRGIVEFSLGCISQICLRSGEWLRCSAGVRQGSALGPLLFAIAMREVIEAIVRTGCQVVAYLDDITIFAPTEGQLQVGIGAAEETLKTVCLTINSKKCVTLQRDNTPIEANVGDATLQQSFDPTKILGTWQR